MPGAIFRKRRSKQDPLEELAEQIDAFFDRGEAPARDGAGAEWRIAEGPVEGGECLVASAPGSEFEFRLLAPPGVLLQRPELVGSLKQWRTAAWAYGFVVGGVTVLELERVREMALNQGAWIDAHSDDRDENVDDQHQPVREDAPSASFLPDRRRVLSVTKSASTFAALVGELPPDSAFARIEGVANAMASRDQFDAAIGLVGENVGEDVARELVLALLHARARSHSWRYTWFLGWTQRRASLHRIVGREVDRARNGHDLTERLASVELTTQELHQVLADMLYQRSHCVRWRVTWPLRAVLGANSFSGTRGVMRHRVQPEYQRLRSGRAGTV